MSSGVQGVADTQQGVPHKLYGEDSKFDHGGSLRYSCLHACV